MDMINLAHGSLYMLGAFLASTVRAAHRVVPRRACCSRSRLPRCSGMLLEVSFLRTLYTRDHLSQVLATFALILIINELVRLVWGSDAALPMPAALSGRSSCFPACAIPRIAW
jgi:branched-chain amino acid transport system permease protein